MDMQQIKLSDNTANPAPVGLLAFGLTTVLLNLHNSGLFPIGSMILGMGIFYGGLTQIIAGIMEWKKNNTFGTTAFISYGAFWLSFVALLVLPKLGWATAPDANTIGFYLFTWGIFTAIMFIGTLRLNKALMFVFGSLATLFFLLAIGDWTGSALIKTIAGIEGVICGASAIYTGLAQVLNEIYGKEIWPIGAVKIKETKTIISESQKKALKPDLEAHLN